MTPLNTVLYLSHQLIEQVEHYLAQKSNSASELVSGSGVS